MHMFSTYKKALKVIDSCKNEYHIEGARNYINLFFEQNSRPDTKNKTNLKIVYVDEVVEEMYDRLLKKLYLKQLEFCN